MESPFACRINEIPTVQDELIEVVTGKDDLVEWRRVRAVSKLSETFCEPSVTIRCSVYVKVCLFGFVATAINAYEGGRRFNPQRLRGEQIQKLGCRFGRSLFRIERVSVKYR